LVLIAAQAAEKGIGRIRLKPIEDASAATLESALLTMAEPGWKIRTDGWQGYAGLKALG
jgi:ISXO2-like transposase domain